MESNSILVDFCQFLQQDLAISSNELALVLQHQKKEKFCHSLPMLLWEYGLISIQELTQVFDWLDNQTEMAILNNCKALKY